MTTKSTRVLLAAVLLAASATVALLATPANAALSLSSAVSNHLQDAEKAMQKKDFKAATDAITAAKGVASRNDLDNYTIARVELAVDVNNNDMEAAASAAILAADSPAAPDKEKAANQKNALLLTMNTKQYPKAIAYAKLLDTPATTDPQTLEAIGNAYYFGGDFEDAKKNAQGRIDAATKAGKVPDRNSLMVLLSAQAGLKDEAGAEDTLEKEVAYYNDPADWAQIVDVTFGTPGLRDVDAIWLGRLLFLVGAPVSQNNANMIGSIAGHLTFFGDAVNAKTHGGVLDPDPVPRADADKKTIAAQIAGEDKANGTYSAKLSEALYSYAMYPEAEAAAKLAISKGGNPDASEAPMVLGQAQASQGKYDDALATFGTVTGGGPATARIVRLWVDYVKIKKSPPVAAAAPATAAAK
ncbi:MAG TPA: hypothetical protein VNW15_10680 [Rhizomicrobium sp.]|jgi:hypothetical protein|nr:hypothetical protein [Rhizomicrobium sp.]